MARLSCDVGTGQSLRPRRLVPQVEGSFGFDCAENGASRAVVSQPTGLRYGTCDAARVARRVAAEKAAALFGEFG